MPTYEVTSPDGQVFEVTAPEGATEQEVLAYAQANFQSSPEAKAPPARNEWGRAAALTARNVIEGAAGTAGIVTDPAVVLWNKLTGRQDMSAANAVGSTLDALGFPNAETGAERFTGAVNRGLSGGAGFLGLGRAAVNSAAPVVRGVGSTLAANPGSQLTGAGLGAGAAQVTQEMGGGPVAQMVAGVAGSLSPAVGASTVRGLARGTDGRPVQAAIDSFRNSGADVPTVGQASGNWRTRGLEALLSRAPGGTGIFTRKAEDQVAGMGRRVEEVAGSLAPGSGAETAGRAIERGVTGPGGFLERFHGDSKRLYAVVDANLPTNSPVRMDRTRAALDRLASPTPGAPRTSQALASSRVASLREAIEADVAQNSQHPLPKGVLALEALPYESVKALRTRLGELIADSSLMADTPIKQLRQVYAALSEDMTQAALATNNPKAIAAVQRANAHYKAGMGRLEVLESVIQRNGGPEKVYGAAMSGTREGATTLRAVMQSLPKDGQKQLAAAVIRRMGRANPSAQNDLGERFSAETFLTNWNSMSPQARSALFDRFVPRYVYSMSKIARLNDVASSAANMRAGAQVFRNPSGTTAAGVQMGTAGTFVWAVLNGNLPLAGGVAGGVTLTNLAARGMTNPRFVEWLAKSTDAPASALAGSLASLKNEAQARKDDELMELATALEDARNQQVANDGNAGDEKDRQQ